MSGIIDMVNSEFIQYITLNEIGNVRFKFPNGYGASVIQLQYSHGLELAVLDPDGGLTYDTPITDDVLGNLDTFSLNKSLLDIKNLEVL